MARHRWLWLGPAVALAVVTMTVEAQQGTGFLDRTVTIGGKPLRYQVYVPFDYTPAKRWPVILFLHGAEAGSPVRYTEYPGVGHNSWDPVFSSSVREVSAPCGFFSRSCSA